MGADEVVVLSDSEDEENEVEVKKNVGRTSKRAEGVYVDYQPGDWVRLNMRGDYKNALGKVYDVSQAKQKVTVKVIPRIDLQNLKSRSEQKKRGRCPRSLNLQRIFQQDLIDEGIPVVPKSKGIYSFYKMDMLDGYLLKEVPLKNVDKLEAPPSDNERQLFDDSDSCTNYVHDDVDVPVTHDFTLRQIVRLDGTAFGMILKIEKGKVHVLKADPLQPQNSSVVTPKFREMKKMAHVTKKTQDKNKNAVTLKSIVMVDEGYFKGRKGSVEGMHTDMVFVHDSHHLDSGGFLCVKASSCVVLATGSMKGSERRNDDVGFRSVGGNEGRPNIVGEDAVIRKGELKGFRARILRVMHTHVQVFVQARLKVVTVPRDDIKMAEEKTEVVAEKNGGGGGGGGGDGGGGGGWGDDGKVDGDGGGWGNGDVGEVEVEVEVDGDGDGGWGAADAAA